MYSVGDSELLEEMSPFNRRLTMATIIIPFIITVGTFIGMWITGSVWATLIDLMIFLIMYNLVGIGVTVGFHRLLTHNSFKTYPIVRYILAFLGTISVQGSVLSWVSNHRKHHKFTDKKGDPHTPHLIEGNDLFSILKGLYHSHVGWLLNIDEHADWIVYAKDLYDDPGMRFISRYSGPISLIGLLIPSLLGWFLSNSLIGALSALLWGGFIRIFFLHHITWSINSLCHFHGNRDFSTSDYSTNIYWLSLFSFGESWHNNHHAFPRNAQHGINSRQIDISYMFIVLLERIGLAWDVVHINHHRKKDC